MTRTITLIQLGDCFQLNGLRMTREDLILFLAIHGYAPTPGLPLLPNWEVWHELQGILTQLPENQVTKSIDMFSKFSCESKRLLRDFIEKRTNYLEIHTKN